MKRFIRKFAAAGKTALVAVTALALVTSGVGTAQKLSSAGGDVAESGRDTQSSANLFTGPPAPKDVQDEMTPNSKPETKQPAALQPATVNVNNTEDRLKVVPCEEPAGLEIPACRAGDVVIVASASLVSSRLCRQSTLLGERPSGTS
jgi:hypothetical protein